MKKVLAILCAILLVGAAGIAQAQPVTLADLLAGGSITVGDKLFSDWTLIQNGGGQFDLTDTSENLDSFRAYDPVDPSLIQVLPLLPLADDPGLQFVATGDALSIGILPNYFGQLDFEFQFNVTVLDPNKLITDNSLELSGAIFSINGEGGSANITIVEKVSANNSLLAQEDVQFDWTPPDSPVLDSSDSAIFAGQSSITVDKNILLAGVGGGVGGTTITLTSFDQRFSQTEQAPPPIPEPGTIVLLGAGLLGFGFFGRRRFRK